VTAALGWLFCYSDRADAAIWPDFLPGHEQTEAYLLENGLMQGYADGDFRPYVLVTERQVVTVAKRGGIRTDLDPAAFGPYPATMGWIEEHFLPGTVLSAGADELCTRFRFAVMLERYGLQPGPCTTVPATGGIQATGALLDEWFASTWYTWRGVARQPRVMGQGELIVRLSREHNVPIWLCLGIGWYESCWCTGGLSLTYNCGWGIKDVKGKWGSIRGVVSGFADYTSVEEMITAFFRLMDSPGYRGYIDARHWDALLERYAPSFENNHRAHVATVLTVRRWCEERGNR
jgi:hypothetical protein